MIRNLLSGFFLIVLTGALTACSTDLDRTREVKGLLRCIQAAKDNCLIECTCISYSEAFSTQEFLQLLPMLEGLDVEKLNLVGKDVRENDTVYNFELQGRKLQVRFCPEEYPGLIATLVVETP